MEQALEGTSYHGFKVVEGRNVCKYTNKDGMAIAVKDHGYNPYEKKLLGITEMTSIMGKNQLEDILGGLTYKPSVKMALVQESDKRPAMNTAAKDFKE